MRPLTAGAPRRHQQDRSELHASESMTAVVEATTKHVADSNDAARGTENMDAVEQAASAERQGSCLLSIEPIRSPQRRRSKKHLGGFSRLTGLRGSG
jgi:hypothetical protein